jgi:myo-inositol-1-phosphate synthase
VSATAGAQSENRTFQVSDEPEPAEDDIVSVLKDSETQVVVNFLPVGSREATEFYANCALRAGVALVNAIPVFVASDKTWQQRFRDHGLPVLGDDFKAQMGATVIQRALSRLFDLRGARLDRSYQLNIGGNTDFLNMMDSQRLDSKRRSKTEAVQSALKERLEDENIRIGPSDYVPWLNDQKIAYMRMEGQLFGGVPMNVEVRISVEDSPNAAAMALTAIRCARIALDRGLSGPIDEVNGFLFKSPSEPTLDEDGYARLLEFAESE